MRCYIILLLLSSYGASASFGIYNRGDSGPRPNVEFFHRLGDWIRHTKERIINRFFKEDRDTSTSLEQFDLDRFNLEERVRNNNGLALDLSTLTIDPDVDWGFQLGNWYLIRKGQKKLKPFDDNDSKEEVDSASEANLTTETTRGPENTSYEEIVGNSQVMSSTDRSTRSITESETSEMPESTTNLNDFTPSDILIKERNGIESEESDNELTRPVSVEIITL